MNFTRMNQVKIIRSSYGLHISDCGKLISCCPSFQHLENLDVPYVQIPPGELKQCIREMDSDGDWPTIEKYRQHLAMWQKTHRKTEKETHNNQMHAKYEELKGETDG